MTAPSCPMWCRPRPASRPVTARSCTSIRPRQAPTSSEAQVAKLLASKDGDKPSTEPVDEPTDLRKTADQALASVSNRSLFVLISDFLAPLDSIRETVARFRHRRHDLLLLQVLDRQELRFDLDDPAPFQDLEGDGRLDVDAERLGAALGPRA